MNFFLTRDDPILKELRDRLIHIEAKVDALLVTPDRSVGLAKGYVGSTDQVYGHITYAQHGDDLILLNIFDSIGVERPSYLDIGAHHPFDISNTALLYARGSRGVNVEANPNLIGDFFIHRPEDITLNCGVAEASGEMTFYMIDARSGRNSFSKEAVDEFVRIHPGFAICEQRKIRVLTVNEIINQYCNGVFPDLLSIDVEGMEEQILKGIEFERWAPKIICAETCESLGRDDTALVGFLKSVGYFRLLKNRGNSFFLQNQYRLPVTGGDS